MTWTPELASQATEELMEAKDLPESDRNEVRHLVEVLRLRKQKLLGKAPEHVRAWLLGQDAKA